MKFNVLIEVKYIPNESIVYKATGTTQYILKDRIDVYYLDHKKETISTNGCKFLVSESGSINAVSENTILKWETDLDTLNYIFGDDE